MNVSLNHIVHKLQHFSLSAKSRFISRQKWLALQGEENGATI
jgi:hypothetical protein